jgi:AcrR family transcriptional regulator
MLSFNTRFCAAGGHRMENQQPADLKRKTPAQARAHRTVETILQATAQILADEGSERLTTNYLAQRAGFSIGTIYQYFPNREAIVLALIERQRRQDAERIGAELVASAHEPVETRIRRIVAILHRAFSMHRRPQRRLVQALLRLAAANGLPSPPDTAAQAIVQIWMESGSAGQGAALNPAERFVLNCALVESLRQAVLQGQPLLGTAEFEDALVRMVLGFLRAHGRQTAELG